MILYVGTYTREGSGSAGIYRCDLNERSGLLNGVEPVAAIENPSFLTIDADRLYAVSEVADITGARGGRVVAFRIKDGHKDLEWVDHQPTFGADPCVVTTDHSGRLVMTANYASASVMVFVVGPSGKLVPTDLLQHAGASHPHSIHFTPDNTAALVVDLGLDAIVAYRVDAERGTATLDPSASVVGPSGVGPRHAVFHPDGRHFYVINELASSVTTYGYEPDDHTLDPRQMISTLPPGWTGDNAAAEIQIAPSGRVLYASNRGHNSIATFDIDPATGTLSLVAHTSSEGRTPRHFTLDPSGAFLIVANQDSNNVVVFRPDSISGIPIPTGHDAQIPRPVCLVAHGRSV